MTIDHQINRRQFIITTAVAGGGLMLGFFLPTPGGDSHHRTRTLDFSDDERR